MPAADAGELSRRSLLIGALGAAAVIGGGLGAGDYELHRHPAFRARIFGCGSSPATPPSDYSLRSASVTSPAMGGASMPWAIAMPRSGDLSALPLVLALPGTDGQESDFVGKLGLPGFATAAGLRACFVSVGNVDSSYYHPRSDGTDFFGFIVDELIPMVESTYGVGGNRDKRAAYGLSMGGFGALLIAQQRPGLLAAAVGSSPAVYPSYHDAITGHPDTFDSEADWQRWGLWEHLSTMGGVPVKIDCGDADPFAPTARQLLERIPHAVGSISSGCHVTSFWRRTATEQMRFIASRLASAAAT